MLAPAIGEERQRLAHELSQWQECHPVDLDKDELSLKLYEQQLTVKGYLQDLPKTLRQAQARQAKLKAASRLRDQLLRTLTLLVLEMACDDGW